MSDDLISRRALYDKAATLEAQALDYVGKLIERDGEETSVEWKIWSAILTERTAFKHDVYDAPSADAHILSSLLAELTHKERTDRYYIWTTSEVKQWIADKIMEMKNDE